MRVAVVGSSGSGKTTLARRLEAELGLPHIELDAINWGPGWFNRSVEDRQGFVDDVSERIDQDRWIACGNYGAVRPMVWGRATHLVWLDYDRSVIMPRLLKRSLRRAMDRSELWDGTGNRETFGRWLDREHPLRWAWDTWARRRAQYEAALAGPDFSHLQVHRIRRPHDLEPAVAALKAM